MKHLAHLVRADARRFRLLLALWVLVQILDAVFRGVRPTLAADPKLAAAADLLATVLFVTRWLGLIVIVPLVVQTHPLVGSDAFWMTRPIPWRALLASKVVLLGTAIVAVPAACELALMLACRVPVAEMLFVTLGTIMFQALWLFIVMALSTTTRNLARFALVAGSVLVALVLLMNIAIAVMLRSMPDGPRLGVVGARSAADPAAGVAMLLLLIVAALAQIVVQYRTRSTRASVATGVAAIATVVLVGLVWPWEERPLAVPDWAHRDSALRLIPSSTKGEFRPLESMWNRSGGWQLGAVHLTVSGVEPSWLISARLADATVQFAEGKRLSTAENGHSAPVPTESGEDPPIRAVMRHVLGVQRVREGWPGRPGVEPMPAIVVSQADFTSYLGATGTYRGRFLMDLDHVRVAGALPLEAGAELRTRRRRIVIDQIVPQAQAAMIRMRHFTTSTLFDGGASRRVSFYLRNRGRAEAVAGFEHEGYRMSAGLALPMYFGVSGPGTGTGFAVTGNLIRFREASLTHEQIVDITPDWLAGAELVIVDTIPAGSVTRTVEIPGFEIAAAPPPKLPR